MQDSGRSTVADVAVRFGLLLLVTISSIHVSAYAGDGAPPGTAPLTAPPQFPSSRYHGQIDGDGRVIPCRCRFKGEPVMLGTVVCMETHVGRVLTRCDLRDGNTSWIPSDTACEMSRAPRMSPLRQAAANHE